MRKQLVVLSFALASVTGAAGAAGSAADEKPYTEGPVTSVSFIRVKDGKNMDYMNYLKSTWRAEHEAEKKAGLVTDYHVYSVEPRHPGEANLILTVTHPNYATLDKTAEFDAVQVKQEGSLKAADKGFADRGSMREVLGSELIQELVLKP
jgi:hypothetical protein